MIKHPCFYDLLLAQGDCCSNRVNGVTVRVEDLKNIQATLDTRKGTLMICLWSDILVEE